MIGSPIANASSEALPSFTDVEGCRQWLDTLPLANAVQSQALLLRQLKILNRFPLGVGERLRMLEMLRDPLISSQESCVRRYAWKPLPLTPAEQIAYEATQALWSAQADGYLQCLAAVIEPGAVKGGSVDQIALLGERAMAAICAAQVDAYPGGRTLPPQSWRLLYRVYSVCEEHGASTLKVDDRPRHGNASGADILAEAALLHVGAPNELTPRQFGWLVRWARHWARRVSIATQAPSSGKTQPLCLDLNSDSPPGAQAAGGGGARWLDVGELRGSIKSRLASLAAGKTPVELGLGEDCVSPSGDRLLKHVYRCWCKGAGKRHEGHAVSGTCSVVVGYAAIHEQLAGRPFTQPNQESELSRSQSDEIATFGRIATHHRPDTVLPVPLSVEEWTVVEERQSSDSGSTELRINRPLASATRRVSNGQLLTLRPQQAQAFLLGALRWIRVDAAESLQAGVEVFPGVPEAVATRPGGYAGATEKYRQAFLLPAVPVLQLPARLVLPVNVFRANLALEMYSGQPIKIRLTELIDRGSDYDCVAYTATP